MKNLEFKARIDGIGWYEQKLQSLSAVSLGTERQTDTYFNVVRGRLKLRESGPKNILISYYREDQASARISEVTLFVHAPDTPVKRILSEQLGIKAIVRKERIKYRIGETVFHLDTVEGLGTFLEVEATGSAGPSAMVHMEQEIDRYRRFLEITSRQLVKESYSDLVMQAEITPDH